LTVVLTDSSYGVFITSKTRHNRALFAADA